MSRCVCGHPADTHTHYRPGADCGACGRGMCPDYIALADRDTRHGEMTATQRILLAESDARAAQVIANLIEHNPAYRERARALFAAIPRQRRAPLGSELDRRRRIRNERDRDRHR